MQLGVVQGHFAHRQSIPRCKVGRCSDNTATTGTQRIQCHFFAHSQGTDNPYACDCDIAETHHNQKVDAPSGTAKLLLDAVVEAEPEAGYHPVYGREGMCGARDPKEIGMHSLRGGTVAGVHEVSFFGQDEEVTLTHRATSRQIFVNGALAAAQKLVVREPGFYTFDQVMFA